MIFGTLTGEVCSVDLTTKEIKSIEHLGSNSRDTILGLCWLKVHGNRFISGSGKGRVCCVDINDLDDIKIREFPTFDRLTSVHTNCTNSWLLLSGYSQGVSLYDLETAKVIREFTDIHSDHINISRFCNTSPYIFSTSSFDGTIKTWDLRLPGPPNQKSKHWIPESPQYESCGPINTLRCNTGIVTIHFSADDAFLIASARDNEINQFSFANGTLNFRYNIPSTGLDDNFTRAYFTASGRYTLTGACEESNVKFLCSYTGELLETVDIYPNKRDQSLYIQSLRGSPRNDGQFCVLANYHDALYRELVLANSTVPSTDRGGSYISDTEIVRPAQKETIEDNDNRKEMEILEEDDPIENIVTPLSHMHSFNYLQHLFDLRCSISKLHNKTNDKQLSDNNHLIVLKHHHIQHYLEILAQHQNALDNNPTNHYFSSPSTSFYIKSIQLLHCFVEKLANQGNLFIHSYIVYSRCSFLYQQVSSSPSPSSTMVGEIDLTNVISVCDWILLSLLIDYLYVGCNALTVLVLRHYCLIIYFTEQDDTKSEKEQIDFLEALVFKYFPKALLTTSLPFSSPEDLFWQICKHQTIWHNEKRLNQCLAKVILRLHNLAIALNLPPLSTKCKSLLLGSICAGNILIATEWAFVNNHSRVMEGCLNFIVNHADAIILPDGFSIQTQLQRLQMHPADPSSSLPAPYPEILSALLTLRTTSLISVFTKDEVKKRKFERCLIEAPPTSQASSDKLENAVSLSLSEEMPVISTRSEQENTKRKSIGLALPKFLGHSAVVMNESKVLFFGGMNRERYYCLSRLLAYDITEDCFNWVTADASKAPITANLNHTIPLQKRNSEIVVLLGGKLKEDFASASGDWNTPKKKEQRQRKEEAIEKQLQSKELNVLRYFINQNEKNVSKGKIEKTIKKDSKTLPENNEEDLKDVDNQSPDEHPRNGRQERESDEDEDESTSMDASSSTDAIFEFNYSSLSWLRRILYYNNGLSSSFPSSRTGPSTSSIARKRVSSIAFSPVTTANQASYEDLRRSFKKRIAQSIVPVYSSDVSYRCPKCLFRDRSFAASCDCWDLSSTSSHSRIEEKEGDNSTQSNQTKEVLTWAVQFAGYCTEFEEIVADVHVLFCRNLQALNATQTLGGETEYEYEWMKLPVQRPVGMMLPSVRFGLKGAFIPARSQPETLFSPIPSSYPERAPTPPLTTHLAANTSRIFFYGGCSYHEYTDHLISLRINSKEIKERYLIEEDCSWEEVRVASSQPMIRYDHSFQYIREGNFCILFGGMYSSGHNGAVTLNDIWLLQWHFRINTNNVQPSHQTSSISLTRPPIPLEEVVVRWTRVRAEGIPPSLRSRHTASYFMKEPPLPSHLSHRANHDESEVDEGRGCLIIFGGMDETIREAEGEAMSQEMLFDERQRESIIHILTWKIGIKDDYRVTPNDFRWVSRAPLGGDASDPENWSKFLNVDCCGKDFIPPLPCTLSQDLQNYLLSQKDNANNRKETILKQSQQIITPDVTFQFEIAEFPSLSLEEAMDSMTLTVNPSPRHTSLQTFSSLLSHRCEVMYRMLVSEMKEGQTKTIQLSSEQTNLRSFYYFIQYLLSDLLLFTPIISSNMIDSSSSSTSSSQERNIVTEIIGLIEIGHYYHMTSLVKKCEGLLVSLITEDTVIEILEYSERMNLDLLKMTCYQYLFRNINRHSSSAHLHPITTITNSGRRGIIGSGQMEEEDFEEVVDDNEDDDEDEEIIEIFEGSAKISTIGSTTSNSINKKKRKKRMNNLSLILNEEICNTEYPSSIDMMEGDIQRKNKEDEENPEEEEEERVNPLVEAFKHASVETKQRFREFALHQVHVFLYDVWKAQDEKAM